MIVAFISAAAAAVICALVYNSKKTILHVLKEIKYEAQFSVVGAGALVDDFMQRKRNRLEQVLAQSGKVAIITGGARGIGAEVVKKLLEAGMTVVLGVRKPEAAHRMIQEFKKNGVPTDNVDVFQLDVSLLESVKEFSESVGVKYPSVNLLVNNAGIMFGDFKLTQEGYESQLATNYLGHFYLTHLLMPSLKAGGEKSETCSRIVNVSSCAHYPGEIFFDDINMKLDYITSAAYAQSKLAQIMFARYLNKQLESEGSRVRCYSVHPGVVNTDLFKDSPIGKYAPWMRLFFKTPKQGAISILYTCLSPKLETRGGLYVSNCRQGLSNSYSKDEYAQKKLFEISCVMTKIKRFGGVVENN